MEDKTCPIKSIAGKKFCSSDCAWYDDKTQQCKIITLFDIAIQDNIDTCNALIENEVRKSADVAMMGAGSGE